MEFGNPLATLEQNVPRRQMPNTFEFAERQSFFHLQLVKENMHGVFHVIPRIKHWVDLIFEHERTILQCVQINIGQMEKILSLVQRNFVRLSDIRKSFEMITDNAEGGLLTEYRTLATKVRMPHDNDHHRYVLGEESPDHTIETLEAGIERLQELTLVFQDIISKSKREDLQDIRVTTRQDANNQPQYTVTKRTYMLSDTTSTCLKMLVAGVVGLILIHNTVNRYRG